MRGYHCTESRWAILLVVVAVVADEKMDTIHIHILIQIELFGAGEDMVGVREKKRTWAFFWIYNSSKYQIELNCWA